MNIESVLLPEEAQLGKKTIYEGCYNSELLLPISRAKQREKLDFHSHTLPFEGLDSWNHLEVSWLNMKGKPIIATGEIIFPADSPYLIESKSMKLYFNSLNHTKFLNEKMVMDTIQRDLEQRVKSPVLVRITPIIPQQTYVLSTSLEGQCLDHLDVECNVYSVDPSLLQIEEENVQETLCTNLLKSNCLVTGQPDWGSLQIAYEGRKINPDSLLRYIISFRNHNEFGEHCIERIFRDIMQYCAPLKLSLLGCYTRRGGIDINCYRTTSPIDKTFKFPRLYRQ